MNRPHVIFFDAVGTLFGVRGSVGEVYAELARHHGVMADAQQLNQAFYQSFKASSPCTFPGAKRAEIPELEFRWWQAIVKQTFEKADTLSAFSDFSAFFTEAYNHFATATPWLVYPDTLPTLKKLQHLEIPMGILSNFDSRLYSVLKALNLETFFSSVTISTEVGVAKPNPKIFEIALEKHHCKASMAWHIGDSYKEDYEAANAAGLRGILVKRQETTS